MNSSTTKKPWGSYVLFTNNEASTVKLLYINKGEQLSLQHHSNRDEFWRVIGGSPELTIGDRIINSKKDDEFIVTRGTNHRISAPTDNVIILEISKGDFDENDIVRIEDKYGR